MRRLLVWAVSGILLAGTVFAPALALAQQQDDQQQKAAALVRLWEQLPQARDPAERIAGAEQALKLEGELAMWPLPVSRDEARARLWRWSGLGYAEWNGGRREENLEQAIAAYERAGQIFTKEGAPREWARTQDALGEAYRNRIRGDRADNLEEAITLHKAALTVLTREAFPEDWALAQANLGTAYSLRIRGDRADNLEMAIAFFEAALAVQTREASPEDWALTQVNLGAAYLLSVRGDRADNVEKAIAALDAALTIQTREAFPEDWALAQANLGLAYSDRIRGDRTDNQEKAIAAFEAILTVMTREARPQDWAATQHRLGVLYWSRGRGDRADNLEKSISHLEAALAVRSRRDQPKEWADTQSELGRALAIRTKGERADNLEKAIAAFESALTALSAEGFPRDWAQAQSALALVYSYRIRGQHTDNVEKAIVHHQSALEVLSREAFPDEWASAHLSLGLAYVRLGSRAENRDRAIQHFETALTVLTREGNPRGWATTQMALGNVLSERSGGDPQPVVDAYEAALTVFNREEFPMEWAIAQGNLGRAYLGSTRGDRPAVLAKAVGHLEAALATQGQLAPRDRVSHLRALGAALSEKGDWRRAGAAYADARQTFLLLSVQGLDDTAAAALINEAGPLFSEAAYAAAQLGETEKALALANEGRARLMGAALKLQTLDLPADKRRRLDALQGEIRAAERTVEAPTTQGADRTAAVERLVALRQELLGLIKDADAAETKARVSALAQARALAGRGGAVVVPIVTRLGGKILIVRSGAGPQGSAPDELIDIPELTAATLNALVYGTGPNDGWIYGYSVNLLKDDALLDQGWPIWMATIDGLGPNLWRLLGARLDAALKRAGVKAGARIVWLPPGALGILPLGLAQDPAAKRRLLDTYEIVYAPSLDALASAQGQIAKAAPSTLAVIVNPTGDLPAAEQEGRLVASLFPAKARAILEGSEATPETVLAALKGRSYWHFATHGTFKWEDVRQSALLMHGLQRLSVGRLLEADGLGRPRLVVLSACETGLHDISRNPDEFIGLPGTFAALGAAGVLGTLWPVNDMATALLVARFYDLHLGERLAPPTALRQAQLWLRQATNADLVTYAKRAARQGRLDRKHVAAIEEELSANSLRRARKRALVEWVGPDRPAGAGRQPSRGTASLARPYAHPYYWAGFIYTGL